MVHSKRNRFTFGIGTVGRDMLYSLVSMYLIFYLTDILRLPDSTLGYITIILVIARIFDAVNDPVMGTIVDNTKTRYGKFKPWILSGAILSGFLTVLLFTDFALTGPAYVAVFAVIYILWGIAFTMNDISYWSMLPSLTTDRRERERIGAFARICANIGLFAVVAGIIPATLALENIFDSDRTAYFVFALIVVGFLLAGQSVTLIGVKEPKSIFKQEQSTTLREIFKLIFKNDQLLYTSISMVLFMIGYVTTTSFGLYFFKYAYKDESMYPVFAVILGVSQIIALSVFPLFRGYFTRKQLYSAATCLVVAGYILFFFSPMNMLFIGSAGILLFIGQAFIQILMLMFLTDTIEYGQWKFGRRNNSLTLSLQPFINKMGGAIGTGVVGLTVILSGINEAADDPSKVTEEGLLMMKSAMLVFPLILILVGFIIYLFKYKIDGAFYSRILKDLKSRGDIN